MKTNKNRSCTKICLKGLSLRCKHSGITWIGNDQMTPERVEGAKCGTGWVRLPCQTLALQVEGLVLQQGLSHLRGQLRCKLREVILGGDSPWGVVHFDFQVGQWVQNRRVGHGNFVRDIMQGVDRPPVHGCRWREVRRYCQDIWVRKTKEVYLDSSFSHLTLVPHPWHFLSQMQRNSANVREV